MKLPKLALLLVLPALLGCVVNQPIWHDQLLPSGKTVKILSFNLAWGIEHDDRHVDQDCFSLEFVTADPAADAAAKEREAWEVFELVRPGSELWGFKTAVLSARTSVARKGGYDIFTFTRGADGTWSVAASELKIGKP